MDLESKYFSMEGTLMYLPVPEPVKGCDCNCCESARALAGTKHAFAAVCDCIITTPDDWCDCEFCKASRNLAFNEDQLDTP